MLVLDFRIYIRKDGSRRIDLCLQANQKLKVTNVKKRYIDFITGEEGIEWRKK